MWPPSGDIWALLDRARTLTLCTSVKALAVATASTGAPLMRRETRVPAAAWPVTSARLAARVRGWAASVGDRITGAPGGTGATATVTLMGAEGALVLPNWFTASRAYA